MFEKFLPRNEHTVERVARVLLGGVGLSLVFMGPKTAWGYLGLIPLVTGLMGSCPLYTVLGISTCSMKEGAGYPFRKNTGWTQAWYPMESVTRARTYPSDPSGT